MSFCAAEHRSMEHLGSGRPDTCPFAYRRRFSSRVLKPEDASDRPEWTRDRVWGIWCAEFGECRIRSSVGCWSHAPAAVQWILPSRIRVSVSAIDPPHGKHHRWGVDYLVHQFFSPFSPHLYTQLPSWIYPTISKKSWRTLSPITFNISPRWGNQVFNHIIAKNITNVFV